MVRSDEEEIKTELLKFLMQKINHAGGSLQFQHLSGLLQQLRFEIKDAFGVNKASLMKFLKANPNTFKVNSKGVVTIVNATLDNNCSAEQENQNEIAKKTSVSKIECGRGYVFKIFSRYAIIEAIYPINTYIFFTPLEYGAGENSLFVDLDLNVGDEVGFNATHGHIDYEIEYRAIKVWIIDYHDENPHSENIQKSEITKTFTSEGVIKKLFPNVGFISVSDKENQNIVFYRKNFEKLNIKRGDRVRFVAKYISKEWQATEMVKIKNINKLPENNQTYINEPSDRSQASIKITDKHISEDSIKDKPGRIYPHSKGAIIKFGKNFSELADGSECNFYLLGIKVDYQDIAVEFSEGDDVKFDAVKSEDSPGWKAVLVWSGDKPATIPKIDKKFKENFGNTKSINIVNHCDFASNHSSEVSESRKTRKIKNNKDVNIVGRESDLNKSKTSFDRPTRRSFNNTPENYHKDNIVASKMMPNKDSRKKYNKASNHKYNRRTSFSKSKYDKIEKNNENWLTSKDPDVDASESSESSVENNELQDSSNFPRKFLKEDNQYIADTLDVKDETYSESEVSSEKAKAFTNRKASIKKFEAIDGEVIHLKCKFGLIKSTHLMKEVDFILNAFYLNGKSVEEQQVTDLKEVVQVGNVIKFNCFEIIDDKGETHQKVTIAWKGSKPNVYEIDPKDFILKQGLSVSSIEPEEKFDSSNSITFEEASELTSEGELNSEGESSMSDKFEDASHEHLIISESRLDDVDEHRSSHVVQPKMLPGVVLRKLETYGFLSSHSEDGLNVAQEIIDLVLKNSSIEDLSVNKNCPLKSDSANLCSSCGNAKKSFIEERTTMDTEVQTIVTGEIVATSIFTEDY